MILGFTGTHKGMTPAQKAGVGRFMRRFDGIDFHHGKCIGADYEAWQIAQDHFFITFAHPSNILRTQAATYDKWTAKPLPPLARNKSLVATIDVLLATPKEYKEQLRSGTWMTIRAARKRNIQVIIIFPDGTKREEEANI